jgi:hypothetical protein
MAAFRIGAEDTPLIAAELGIQNHATLTDTANFSTWIKSAAASVPTEARLIATLPPDQEAPPLSMACAPAPATLASVASSSTRSGQFFKR